MSAPPLTVYRPIRHLPTRDGVPRMLVRWGDVSAELWHIGPDEWPRMQPMVGALACLRSDHIVRLLDVACEHDGSVLLVRTASEGTPLSELIDEPGWVTAGRAVTVLQPLVEAVRDAHESGVVVGPAGILGVLVTTDGRPVITDLGAARVGAPLPSSVRDHDPEHRADIDALERIRSLLQQSLPTGDLESEGDAMPTVTELLASPSSAQDWASPEPLVGTRPNRPRTIESANPTLVGSTPTSSTPISPPRSTPDILRNLGFPAQLIQAVDDARQDFTRRVARLRQRGSAVSRRSLAFGAAAAAVVAALAISAALSAVPSSRENLSSDESTLTVSSGGSSSLPDGDAASVDSGAVDPTLEAHPEDWIEVVTELAVRWDHCRREARVLCPEAVQSGAPAADHHRSDVSPEWDAVMTAITHQARDVAVLERAGDTVVVLVTAPDSDPASLLLMRGEAGWRVRDLWT